MDFLPTGASRFRVGPAEQRLTLALGAQMVLGSPMLPEVLGSGKCPDTSWAGFAPAFLSMKGGGPACSGPCLFVALLAAGEEVTERFWFWF